MTNCSLDRVITPSGGKMININDANVSILYNTIRSILPDANMAAQIAVNIIDCRDIDSTVTTMDVNGVIYYGFERPCIYISELAYRSDVNGTSYAVELYKPYSGDNNPSNEWKLLVNGMDVAIINWPDANQYHVIINQDPATPLNVDPSVTPQAAPSLVFDGNDVISLTRSVDGNDIVVDSVSVLGGWMIVDSNSHSIQRDIMPAKCIRRLWDSNDRFPTLGINNTYQNGDLNFIQAHPKNDLFINIGQIGMIFRKGAYYPVGGSDNGIIGYNGFNNTEPDVRLNLADPNFQQIFKYLTVIDPHNHISDANETRIKGRININTAPAFVLAQLPWVSHRKGYNNTALAKAITAYRDKSGSDPNCNYASPSRPGGPGLGSIGELCNVTRGTDPNYGINYYSRDKKDQPGFPDLTYNDTVLDDFEERDLIFARISDLVTVRSDVFTAYMLVRIGTDGPQKRYMVILDRSGVTNRKDKVYVTAFQTVPEAR